MVSVSFAYKELKDVIPKVQNVKSLNEKAHYNLLFFCCLNIARLKVLVFREGGRKKAAYASFLQGCVYTIAGIEN